MHVLVCLTSAPWFMLDLLYAFNNNQMEQRTLKNVNSYWNTKFPSYSETFRGQNSNLHLNVVHFFNASVHLTSVTAKDRCFHA